MRFFRKFWIWLKTVDQKNRMILTHYLSLFKGMRHMAIPDFKATGMTQRELAEKLDVKPQALTRIMKGRQTLPCKRSVKLREH